MDIGTILSIGSTVMASRKKQGGGSGNRFDAANYYEDLRQGRMLMETQPLQPARPVAPPEQVTYDQTRQFWASLLTDYLRG
jgi:hypothetical protein